MKASHFLLTACLLVTAASNAIAQHESALSESDFHLHRYEAEWVNSHELSTAISELYGRLLVFDDRAINNISLMSDSLVIYETQERLENILAAIQILDFDTYTDEKKLVEIESEVKAANMILKNYQPQHLEAVELYELASRMYQESYLVDGSWKDNLMRGAGGNVMLHAPSNAIDQLLEQVTEIDLGHAPKNLITNLEYIPRHTSPRGLMRGMESYVHFLNDPRDTQSTNIKNISLAEESGVIIIRDTHDRALEIYGVLVNLDRPAPQMMVVCQILRGTSQEPERQAATRISEQLRQILAHEYYEVVAAGMLRSGMVPYAEMELHMKAAIGPETYQLFMEIGSFDEETLALRLEECKLSKTTPNSSPADPLFATSATLFAGEYAVLGVTGAEPLFLVVQLLPVQTQR